jgi:hypothetical protein
MANQSRVPTVKPCPGRCAKFVAFGNGSPQQIRNVIALGLTNSCASFGTPGTTGQATHLCLTLV